MRTSASFLTFTLLLWLAAVTTVFAEAPRCGREPCNRSNAPPGANAGPDQTAAVGTTVFLNGAQSTDADGPQPLTYTWTIVERPAGSSAVLDTPNAVAPAFVVDRPGRYVASLVVNDGVAASPADQVVVSTFNSPPVANGGPDRSVFVGDWVFLQPFASTDVDGDPLSYTWTLKSKPAGSAAELLAAMRPRFDGVTFFRVDAEGTYTVELVVADGTSTSAPDIIVITTGNTTPVANPKASCAAVPNVGCSVPIGTAVTVDGNASTDVDGDPLTYAWAMPSRPAGSGAALSTANGIGTAFTSDAPGNFVVQLIVNDGKANSAPKTVTITSTNAAPTAVAAANPISIATLPQTVQLDGSASLDPEGQGLTYAWSLLAKPAGSSATLSSTTAQKPTLVADLTGTYTAQLIVNDGFLSSTPVTVNASTANQPPNANAGPDQIVAAGATVQLSSAGSSDPEGSPLGFFWSMLNKPAGSTTDFNNANAANPTFPADRKGTFVAQLIVNDGVLDSAPDTVQITATNRAPVAVADGYTVAQDGSLIQGAIGGVLSNDTDADGDALTAILVGAAPSGLTLNADGGFTYTPAAGFSGSTPFQYKANDGTVDSNTVTVTITVTPGLPTVTVVATTPDANEAGPVHGAFTITRSGGDIAAALSVVVTMTGTSSNNADYAFIGNQSIPAGQTSVVVPVTVLPDAIAEGDETAILTIQANAGYTIGASGSATVTIADVTLPTVTIVATDANASEIGPDTGVITITRSGPTTFALDVFYSVTGSAGNGGDFSGATGHVNIPAGQTSATVTITPIADAAIEGDETAVLTLAASPAAYLIGAQGSATVTIADGVPNTVTIVATDANASEIGPDTGVITITRSGPTTFALDVFYSVTGSAGNGGDFSGATGHVNIPAGQTSATVTITPIADAAIEGDETAVLTLAASPAAYLIGAQGSATVTIADGVPNTVTIVATDANASEIGPDTGVITITRSGPTTFALDVFYSVTGSAGNGGDFSGATGHVNIPAGQTSATVTITPIADAAIEGDETAVLTLAASPAAYLIGAQGSATVTIADGVPNTVTIVATDANASEIGPDTGVITITRSGPTTFALDVFYSVTGSAGNGGDFSGATGHVNIPAGQTSATVTITPIADAAIEGDETAVLTLAASPAAYLIGAQGSATVTIADGVPNTVTIVATDANASEIGPDTGVFTITRSGPTTFALDVFYSVTGTAGNGGDFSGATGHVNIPAGQTSATVTITPIADAAIEGDETAVLTLAASPAAYLIGAQGSATVTIADGVPNTVTIVATDANASEIGPDTGVFTITRSGPTTFALDVFYSVTGTAGNGGDFSGATGHVNIPAGQTSATVTITPIADGSDPGETVILTLGASPTAYLVGAPNSATVTID